MQPEILEKTMEVRDQLGAEVKRVKKAVADAVDSGVVAARRAVKQGRIESNNTHSARSASHSELEWDWERRSAFFWLATAAAAGEALGNRAISLRK
jgi:hypothetical protein